uniref:VWFA domain-containing protein n=1 Tax=Pyxicephalus adspersus TaxID=30357 RepID=A0AAV3AIP5_PYXAD|nr:TPA: hypothetical protein GDO54_012487 [Pyxicephalus adspersus]
MKLVTGLLVVFSWLQLSSSQDTEIPKYGDLIFLLDSSDSMGEKVFNQLKLLISRMVNQMQIGVDHYRVGLVQYNEDIDVGFSLSAFRTKNQMINYIKNKFVFKGGSLMTGNALTKVQEIFLSGKNGRDKSKYPQVLVVITSGSSNDDVNPSIATLKQEGIQIVTVGVKEASLTEMEAMATSPKFAFKIDNFKDLNKISKDMVTTIQEVVENTYYVEGTQVCLQGLATDVVFMVDISQHSQSESKELNNFLKQVISGLEISDNCVHVGIMVFDSSPRLLATLDTGDNKTLVEQLLGEIKSSKEKISNIGEAFNFTRTNVFGGKESRRKSQGIPKVAILVSHRSSADNVSAAAVLLHKENAKLFTVGIAQANDTQMAQVASYPPNFYYVKVKTFSDLSTEADILRKKIVNVIDLVFAAPEITYQIQKGCLNTELADIYLLIDGSGSIQVEDFKDIRTFLETLVEMFDIGPQKVRVAAVQYSEMYQLEFGIDKEYSKDSLKLALQNMRQLGGGTNTGAAINFTREIIAGPKSSTAQDRPIYLIVLTDGESQDSVKEAAEMVRGDNVNVYAIGVKAANQTQLLEIAGDHSRVHYVHNFDSLKGLKNVLAQQICSAEVCHNVAADIMFLVDSSGSIGKDNFLKMKTFMKTLVNKTDVGPEKVQFGVVQFSDDSMEVLRLNKNGNKDSIWDAIDKMNYLEQTTYTGKALQFVADYFKEEKGARPRVKKILIIITDGVAHDDVKAPAESLRNNRVTILSVGIFNADKSQLLEMSGKEELVKYLETFDSLKEIEDKLIFDICTPVEDCPRVQLADIVFVIDSSSSISNDQFYTMKNFIIALVNKSEVGPNNVQFGALMYSNYPHKNFYLNEHKSKQSVIKAIQDVPSIGGDTYTAKALEYAKSFFTEKHGSRHRSRVDQILIVITDGDSHDHFRLNETSKALQDAGIIIYAIGVKGAKTNELMTMAGSKGKWFFVENFDGLNQILPNITGDVCNKTACEIEEADLIFLIDGSYSISEPDFEEMKKFMISVVEDINVENGKVHVGVGQYSDSYKVEFKLKTHRAKRTLKEDIEKIPKIGGNTHIGNALTRTDKELLSPSSNSRIREGIRQILVVITDGVSQDEVGKPAQALRGKGIDIYAIGVGGVDESQLIQIAGSAEKKFFIGDFSKLKNIKQRIVRNICSTPIVNNCTLDVVVAFDISSYPNGANLFHGQSHLEARLDKILYNMMNVRASTCSHGIKPQISVAFYVPNAETQVPSLFQVYNPDIARNLIKTNVTQPLYLKSSTIKSMWNKFKNKEGRTKMLLLFTDGLDDDVEDLEEAVEDLRRKGLSALVTVALEGAKHYDVIQYIEFGRGFEYNYQMYIGMPDIGTRLSKHLSHVVEKTCCCVFCKCMGERGSPGPYGQRGKWGSPGRKGVTGHSGEEGEEGARGIPGPMGESGEKGCAGNRGPKGNRGLPGEANEEGENGLDGIPGEQGDSGHPGTKGEKGERGEAGSTGTKGPPGEKGEKGFRGDAGNPGTSDTIPGPKGYKGDLGIEGEPGQPGNPGSPGSRGAGNLPGRRGVIGPPGEKGNPGLPGFMGDQGVKGPQGTAGSKGGKGEKGSEGPNGLSGAFGAKGSMGNVGNPGAKGKKGEIGEPGEKGSPGPRGQRGSMGEDGKPGFGKTGKKGTKGDRGFPGNSGIKGLQGDPGVAGERGPKGLPGRTVSSSRGKPGDPGQPGPPGQRGKKGDKGQAAQTPCELIDFIRQTCQKSMCPTYPTELVLALDMANGMTPEIFTRMIEMVTSLLSNIAVRGSNCPSGARVAVVSYNTHTKILIRFSDFHNQEQLLSAVKKISLESSGRRDIGNSMRFVGRNIFKRSAQGATVQKIAVFFSNGPSEDVVSINTAVMEYSALGIIPAVIAFTPAPTIKRAFSVDDTGTFKLIDIPQTADYKPLLRTLQTCTLCFDRCKPDPQCVNKPSIQRPPIDIAFLLDSSYNMMQDNFAEAKRFISTIVDRLNVSGTGDRVALVSNVPPNFQQNSDASPHVEFDLSTYDNNIVLKKHLLNVRHLQGPPVLGFTLQWTIENIMSKVSNARKHKAIVLILAGETSTWDKQTLTEASLYAKCQGHALFVLFTGKTYNDTKLMNLPSIPVDHHLLQVGRIHKPEFGYAVGFLHSFFNSIRRSINKYPPPELKSKCSTIGRTRGKRLA